MKSVIVFVLCVALCSAFELYRPSKFLELSIRAEATTGDGSPCTAEAQSACANDYSSCVNDTTSMDTICECLGDYGLCLYDWTCLDANSYNSFITSCENDVGCPAYYCGTPVSTGTLTTGTQACDNTDIIDCVESFSDCTAGKTSQQDICECYGDYGVCLNSFNCLYGALYDAFEEGCQNEDCTYDQCNPISSGSTSSDTLSSTSDTTGGGCGDFEYECGDYYYVCINGSSSEDTLCLCYGEYGYCLFEYGCIDSDQYNDFIDACESAGCPSSYCGNNPATTGTVECTTVMIDQCVSTYESCINNTSELADICTCYGQYGTCLYMDGCFADNEYNTFVSECKDAGCSTAECNPDDLTSGTSGTSASTSEPGSENISRKHDGGNGNLPKKYISIQNLNIPKRVSKN